MSPPLVPLSILAGSCIIGAGVYFGLAARAPASVVPAATAPAPATPPAATKTAAPDARDLAAQVAAELARRKAWYATECWAPALKADPSIATSRYRFMISLDAQGKENGRGISELRDAPSRPDVARCLRQLVEPPIQIRSPGEPAQVELDVELP
jgi:hypothetical protein